MRLRDAFHDHALYGASHAFRDAATWTGSRVPRHEPPRLPAVEQHDDADPFVVGAEHAQAAVAEYDRVGAGELAQLAILGARGRLALPGKSDGRRSAPS